MVDVTVPLGHFCGSLGLCLIAWNPLIPIIIEVLTLIGITHTVTAEMILPRLAAGMCAMYIIQLYNDEVNAEEKSTLAIIIQSLVCVNIRLGAIVSLHTLSGYIYPIPTYIVLNIIMAYPFFFEGSRRKWESYLTVTFGYNFLFGLIKAFGLHLSFEMQIILLITPSLALMIAKDAFPKIKLKLV